MKRINFVLAGVGGQGILLASDVLCQVGLATGYDVKKTDAHGMSQRGGSVVSHVRFGEEVLSPVVCPGQADYLLAFEKLEAARWVSYLAPGGTAVVSDEVIPTLAALSASPRRSGRGGPPYPDASALEALLTDRSGRLIMVPAGRLAAELGNARVANVILLGTLSTVLDAASEAWRAALKERVPPRFLELNLQAFEIGRTAASADPSVTGAIE